MPEDKFQQLLAYLRANTRSPSRKIRFIRGLALVLYLADSGGRIGGAWSLQVNDLQLDSGTGTVTEKGDKSRTVAYGPAAVNALRMWLLIRKGDLGDYVFSYRGNKLKESAILGQFFRRLCIDAGIGSWGPHSLRHRKGFQLSDSGVSITIAAEALGHSSTGTTEQYYPHDWDRAQKAIRDLSTQPEDEASNIIQLPRNRAE